jgi:hypothetical protein
MAGLYAAEQRARAAQLGIWHVSTLEVLRAADRDALAGAAGRSVVVEGRVISIGETRARAYLNFGPVHTRDFAATVTHRNLATFEREGLALASLKGQIVRVRGLLDLWPGPQIELTAPSAIEIVAAKVTTPYSGPLVRR